MKNTNDLYQKIPDYLKDAGYGKSVTGKCIGR